MQSGRVTQGRETDSPAVSPVTDRFEEIMLQFERRMPRTIYEEYLIPDTDQFWWYDLVTGDAVFERPLNSIVLTDRSANG